MANPICLSPLKFYDDFNKQSHRKSYAYKHISPLIFPLQNILPFQFVLRDTNLILTEAYLVDVKTDEIASANLVVELSETGFVVDTFDSYNVAIYPGYLTIQNRHEGQYYLKLVFESSEYYSEVFCFTNSLSECLEIEYWNKTGNFYIKNGIIAFSDGFHFKLYLKSEIGKPEYSFEEESTKRLGYNFVESQVSKKIYRFNVVVPEFICDALRIVRMCDNKIIRSNNEEYDALAFEMDVEWQTQGDLASVNCEFETDNVITNFGGFKHEPIGGDYNDDYNDDYDV